jgi:hypothetical protein
MLINAQFHETKKVIKKRNKEDSKTQNLTIETKYMWI